MEKYEGVKFRYKTVKNSFSYDHRLSVLNRWAFLFAQLGLTPVHCDGAYGNMSYRTGTSSFVITVSGMTPAESLEVDSYCHVKQYNQNSKLFKIEGKYPPSSESFLHNALYQSYPDLHTILHGHCALFEVHAKTLNIPVTDKFYDYGTTELADSALRLMDDTHRFFILKNHGFVAVGQDIDSTGKLSLDYLKRLINVLQTSLN